MIMKREKYTRRGGNKDPKTIAEKTKPLAEHGTNQHREDRGLDNTKSSNGGTSASYLTARLARDCPFFYEKK